MYVCNGEIWQLSTCKGLLNRILAEFPGYVVFCGVLQRCYVMLHCDLMCCRELGAVVVLLVSARYFEGPVSLPNVKMALVSPLDIDSKLKLSRIILLLISRYLAL